MIITYLLQMLFQYYASNCTSSPVKIVFQQFSRRSNFGIKQVCLNQLLYLKK